MKIEFSYFKYLSRLYFIHFCGIIAVGLGFYYGLEFVLSTIYLVIIFFEIKNLPVKSFLHNAAYYFSWQGLALFCSFLLIGAHSGNFFIDNAVFILQYWSTPIYPWMTLFSNAGGAYAFSYYALISWPWVSVPVFFGIVYRNKIISAFNMIVKKITIFP